MKQGEESPGSEGNRFVFPVSSSLGKISLFGADCGIKLFFHKILGLPMAWKCCSDKLDRI